MKASLKLILISPCLFIMAPRVTPARCMKCPASCHPCPLPLYLFNLFLLPSLPLSLPPFVSILSHPLPSTYWGPLEDTNASSAHINVMYSRSQEGAVCFFPSLNLSCSQACSWLPSFHRDTLRLCLPLLKRL